MDAMPPLNPLHVFEVAARLLSFTRAAEELRVSQPAVSRQIQTLEDYFGFRLFERDRTGLRMTPQGEELQRQIGPAFRIIEQAAERLIATGKFEPLRLRVYTTFAAKWLIERLPSFYAAYPGVKLDISNAVAPVDFERDKVDLAIQFGDGKWKGVECELLFRDRLQPVCSPALRKAAGLRTVADLRKVPILHSHYRRTDWTDWLMANDQLDLLTETGITFPSSVLTYQAATEGVGVAIGQLHLLRSELRNGALVALFDRPLERPLAHYVVWSKTRPLPKKARSFLTWLRSRVVEFHQ